MNSTALAPVELARLARHVCALDVQAFKPGNVSVESPGHGMTAEDFLNSAEAVALPLTLPRLKVGERILTAIKATRATVDCNTNLGIVLLLAPLIQATLLAVAQTDLRVRLSRVLGELDIDDAALAYAAIRLARPAGLGESARHDVNSVPQVTLLEAMREAEQRDRIAHQYASDFDDVFAVGVPVAREAIERGMNEEWATVAVYLVLLSRFPDSHIERKFGRAVAERVSRQAAEVAAQFRRAPVPESARPRLLAFDQALKRAGINPGTSADLTVASLAAVQLQQMLDRRVDGRIASEATGRYPQRNSNIRAFY